MNSTSANAAETTCPASCGKGHSPANECAWVDDMLKIFGGMLFLGVSRARLAPHAPCRRALRAAQAAVGDERSVASVPSATH